MQHIGRLQDNGSILISDCFVLTTVVGVVKMAVFVTVNHHTVWHQRIQGYDFTFTVADDLRIGVTPQKQVRHECFPEYERGHFRIWLIVKQRIQWMVDSFFFAAGIGVAIQMQRKTSHSLCQDAHTGINCGHLHGRALGYGFARGGTAKQETIAASGSSIGGLVSGLKYSR